MDITTKWQGLFGLAIIFGLAFALSNNRKAINYRLVFTGLALQLALAFFVLKVEFGQALFQTIGDAITHLLHFSDEGAGFVFGPLVKNPEKLSELFGPAAGYIFAFRVVPTIIFVSSLVSISYYLGLMQKLVQLIAQIVAKLMGASGAEAISNAASVFVGQVEAQLLIKPYLPGMTKSELLASMTGSMACVAGGVLAVYIGLGIKAAYLLTASVMAAPGALVIAKIVYPETEISQTMGKVKLEVKRHHANLIDAAAHGASDGLRIGLNVVAMLIAFVALIAFGDACVAALGRVFLHWHLNATGLGLNLENLHLKDLFGALFSPLAWALGVPQSEARTVGMLMAEKLVINEFIAYTDLSGMLHSGTHLSRQAETIATFALCGFANFSSIAIQIGGIGEMAPSRREDLAKLGIKALVCGTMASYLSACLAGLLN
jgi:CNT family concentrative nucleoside transporter